MFHRQSAIRGFVVGAGIVALGFATVAAWAQGYPSKPIEIVVHTSPGGGTDLFTRAVAEMITRGKLISQPVNVINRPGGSGGIAFNYVKGKRGDPHVILGVATGSFLTASIRPDLDLGPEHFTPLAFFALDPQAIIVPADGKFASFKDLIDAAKREPGTITCAVASAGGTGRQTLWMMERATGTRFRFVAFKSGGDAITQVLGGHVAFSTENVSEANPHVEAKKLRFLAVTSERRLESLPDVPTLTELGVTVQIGTGRGFAMSAGVPKEAAAYMEGVLHKVHQSKAWKDLAQRNMFDDRYMGSAEFTEFLAKRRVETREFVESVGLKPKR